MEWEKNVITTISYRKIGLKVRVPAITTPLRGVERIFKLHYMFKII